MTSAKRGLLICLCIAVLGGGTAGIGLANYTSSGSFDFYKGAPRPVLRESATPGTADYPATRSSLASAYPENPLPPRAAMVDPPAAQIDYSQLAEAETSPAVIEKAVAIEDPLPVITARKGSWSAPAEPEPADEPVKPGETIY